MPNTKFSRSEPYRYGIVLDAGSSGTRLHIYQWLDPTHARKGASDEQLKALPVIETKKKWTKKTHPGISTFGEKPGRVGPDHLKELFDKAKDVVPKHEAERTPLFLLATAGMRLLPPDQRAAVLKEVCSYARSSTPFILPDCDLHVRVIPGEVEGLYGWIAANYLLGGFDAPKAKSIGNEHPTFGFLDMGGASAQIAFAPNTTEAERHADDLKMLRLRTIDGSSVEYQVFTTTFLRFGVNEARKRYVEALEHRKKGDGRLADPCLPSGLKTSPKGDIYDPGSESDAPTLEGTGKFAECLKQTLPLLEKDHICEDDPCLIGGVHVPAIDFDVNHFVGVSEYWHTTHEIFEMGAKDKAYDFNTYQERVNDFCSQSWDEIEHGLKAHEWGKKVDEKTAVEVCFKASWIINILHEGIGVPRVGLEDTPDSRHNSSSKLLDSAKSKGFVPSFRPINKIEDVELSWTLGKIVLYAASQVPPAAEMSKVLPVGFGSNEPGIPADFQHPSAEHLTSSSPNTTIVTSPSTSESAATVQSTSVLRTGTSRRIPGILFFSLILFFGVYFLACRRRRHKSRFDSPQYKNLTPTFGSGRSSSTRRPWLPRFFDPSSSSGQGTYKRVDDMEDGMLAAPDNFELEPTEDIDGGGGGSASDSSSNSYSSASNNTNYHHRPGSSTSAGGSRPRSSNSNGNAGFDHLGTGHGLGISNNDNPKATSSSAVGAAGFVRTQSRERLVGLHESGKRSRKGSPQRASGLRIGTLLED